MIEDLLSTYGYLAIILITFLEGESIVILAGVFASQGLMDLNLVVLSAVAGSFAGDQLYYTIGRHYGTPLLARWPHLGKKIDWAFRLVRRYEIPFILSFRFIYGVRNVSPFVIGMSGVRRIKFMSLNLIAACVWAGVFSFGGYYVGRALEEHLGEYKWHALTAFGVLVVGGFLFAYVRKALAVRRVERADGPVEVARALPPPSMETETGSPANDDGPLTRTRQSAGGSGSAEPPPAPPHAG